MIREQIKNQILNETCSNSLKKAIQTTKFELSDFDLLLLAYEHAPNYDTKIKLLNLLAENTNDMEVKEQATKCIAFEKEKLHKFIEPEENCIFEVKIKEKQNSWEERYLAKTFDGALKKVEHFCKHYDFVEMSDSSRFEIAKRQVIDELTFEEFDEDCRGEATYNADSILIKLWHEDLEDGLLNGDNKCDDDEQDCCGCKHKCFTSRTTKLPQFVKNFDTICYKNYYGEKEYAVAFVWNTEKYDDDDCAYCIPLKKEKICSRQIKSKKAFWDLIFGLHTHIQYPLIEIIQADDLPTDNKKAYETLMRLNEKFNDLNLYVDKDKFN